MVVVTVCMAAPAFADTIAVSYSAAQQVLPDFSSLCANTASCDHGVENFSGWNGAGTFSSNFSDAGPGTDSLPSGVSFSGTYSAGAGTTTGGGGEWVSAAQNQFGGASGQHFPELYGPSSGGVTNHGTARSTSYNLALTATGIPGANYFGVWISALDANNDLRLFDGSTLVADINSSTLLTALGSCSAAANNPYCGNPTIQFHGKDSSQLFVYVNVLDLNGIITDVNFVNSGGSGFETSNDAVGYLQPLDDQVAAVTPLGRLGIPIDEPGSLATMMAGLLGAAAWRTLSRIRTGRIRAASPR
jgi:hypothetical protein